MATTKEEARKVIDGASFAELKLARLRVNHLMGLIILAHDYAAMISEAQHGTPGLCQALTFVSDLLEKMDSDIQARGTDA